MLIGPCALTIVGAATVAAAPAAATLRKRRRLEVLPMFDLVMVSSLPWNSDPLRISPFLLREVKDLRRGLARMFGMMRRYDADCDNDAPHEDQTTSVAA